MSSKAKVFIMRLRPVDSENIDWLKDALKASSKTEVLRRALAFLRMHKAAQVAGELLAPAEVDLA